MPWRCALLAALHTWVGTNRCARVTETSSSAFRTRRQALETDADAAVNQLQWRTMTTRALLRMASVRGCIRLRCLCVGLHRLRNHNWLLGMREAFKGV
mgnify:CR=1 FL=1